MAIVYVYSCKLFHFQSLIWDIQCSPNFCIWRRNQIPLCGNLNICSGVLDFLAQKCEIKLPAVIQYSQFGYSQVGIEVKTNYTSRCTVQENLIRSPRLTDGSIT